MLPNKLLLKFLTKYPLLVIQTIILGFSGALFNGVSTALIVPVILNILGQDIDFSNAPAIIKSIMYPFDSIPDKYRSLAMSVAVIVTIFFKNLTSYISTLSGSNLKRKLTTDIRQASLQLLLEIDISYYTNIKIGDLMNRFNAEIPRAAISIASTIKLLIIIITILVFLGLLLSISWQLTICSTLLLSLVALINQYAISHSKYFGKQLTDTSKALTNSLIETLSGIRLVKATANEYKTYNKIKKLINEREIAEFKSQLHSESIAPTSEVTSVIVLILIVFLARFFFADRITSLSALLLTYLLVLMRLLPFISQLNTLRSSFANNIASVDIVTDFLRTDNKPFMVNGKEIYTKLEKEVHFNNISFAYPGHDNLVLKDVDLCLPRGTTLALVGASGAGKSTLADLLPRFYDPISGCITIDGVDIRNYEIKFIRKKMGIVSQDTFLFNDSVRNNIAYSKFDASDEEIITASKRANAYEFIEKLPQGFDTMIGDRGVMLSGGQRQRLAIARALVQDPEILILDEATSALDTVSERLVQAAIDDLSRDRTTLVIAHRLSTVQKAHQIAVFDQGRVVELGTHEELLQKGGYYSRLYSMQFSEQVETNRKSNQAFIHIFYEIRTRLNSIIGCLRLLINGMIDNDKERQELLNESYKSALIIITNIKVFEESIKLQHHLQKSVFIKEDNSIHNLDKDLIKIFNELKIQLNKMLGILVSLTDGLVANTQEQNELMTESYHLAVYLLEQIDIIENKYL